MKEAQYQAKLKKKLEQLFPGCVVLKNDAGLVQGIPDLSIFYKTHWAMLEVKESSKAAKRPNQELRVKQMNDMSFAAFIYPENEEDILNALSQVFLS